MKYDFKSKRICYFIYFYLSSAVAQVQLPPDKELSRERQERVLQEQQRRLDELKSLLGQQLSTPSVSADDSTDCLQVNSIELSGAISLPVRKRTELLQSFVKQCLTAKGLNRLLSEITNYYLNRGYVTARAYLPPQDTQDGVLQIKVIEGRLESIDRGLK